MSTIQTVEKVQWFFENDGERKGPFTEEEIIGFVKNKLISRNTSVWKSGTQDWIKAANSELKLYFNSAEPPPLMGENVSNGIVWVLAFAPLIGNFLQGFFAGFIAGGVNTAYYDLFPKLWWITIALNITLCFLDENKLKKAGHSSKKLRGWVWLVPVYLFQRSKLLNQSISYFVAWIVCFIVSIYR